MKRRKNKLDPQVFEEARRRVEDTLPYGGIKKGFWIRDLPGASVFGGIAKVADIAMAYITGDSVTIRAYRNLKDPQSDLTYKVDEYRNINKSEVQLLEGSETADHHMRHGVPEDIMAHNHIAIEMVPDGAGGLQPNKRPDGMMDVYINFPDPTEQILKRAMERANNRHSPESGVSEGGAGK